MSHDIIPMEVITTKIHLIREQKVILDRTGCWDVPRTRGDEPD